MKSKKIIALAEGLWAFGSYLFVPQWGRNNARTIMRTLQHVNPASAYLEGMIWAAFGERIFSDNASEWQIDAVSKCDKKQKEKEIEYSTGEDGMPVIIIEL